MPRFVLMTRLSTESMKDAGKREATGKEWLDRVKRTCPEVKWVAHYALLGPYDFMDIYDAPDVEMAHRISVISRMEGALTAESWQALPWEDYLRVLEEVKD